MKKLFHQWDRKQRFTAIVLALFGASFHVLTTIDIGGTRLRVGSSDFLLPLFALAFGWMWYRDGFPIPKWRINFMWFWLAALTAWFLVALINGRVQMGEWFAWALVNKGVGWFVLMGYFLLGGWIGAFSRRINRDILVHAFIVMGWFVCLVSLVPIFLDLHSSAIDIKFKYPRAFGLAENPNAFSILIAATVVLAFVYHQHRPLLPKKFYIAGITVSLTVLYFSFSKSAILGLGVSLVSLWIIQCVRWRALMAAMSFTAAFVLSISLAPTLGLHTYNFVTNQEDTFSASYDVFSRSYAMTQVTSLQINSRASTSQRVNTSYAALDELQSSPVLGIGLGSFYKKYAGDLQYSPTIHNTPLWILTEMGAVGFLLFAGFFIIIARGLFISARRGESVLAIGGLGVLLVYAGASVGTEIMYQRPLWLLSGLALALTHGTADNSEAID